MGYLAEGILPKKHEERYKLKRLVTRYLLDRGILFMKGYDENPLRCLKPEEAKGMLKSTLKQMRGTSREKEAI